jgi:hypothetical protein
MRPDPISDGLGRHHPDQLLELRGQGLRVEVVSRAHGSFLPLTFVVLPMRQEYANVDQLVVVSDAGH